MNNPAMALISAVRRGQNPTAILQQMAMSDPRAVQAQRIMAGKSAEQLRQMCENMCRERGISPQQIAQDLGIPNF